MAVWWQAFKQALDLLFKPLAIFEDLARTRDLKPAVAAWLVTCGLFALTSITSEHLHLPMQDPPLLTISNYRLWQAAALPAIFGAGCLLTAGITWSGCRLFGRRAPWSLMLSVAAPAILVPLWPMLWPTEMALSLGVLDIEAPGFPGIWARDITPALTFIYMVCMLWMGIGRSAGLHWRESFAIAVISIVPTLGLWALVLR